MRLGGGVEGRWRKVCGGGEAWRKLVEGDMEEKVKMGRGEIDVLMVDYLTKNTILTMN